MSGHSKWSKIKRAKGAQDAERSKIFQKISKEIYVAAKSGDKDPSMNPSLRTVIEKAKTANMPKDKIQAAIDKAHSSQNAESYEEVRYEGYGPSGIAVMVDCLTDNKNRTAPAVRAAFAKKGGNLGTDGSVSYLFSKKGIIIIEKKYSEDDLMLKALDAGAEDFIAEDDSYIIYTSPESFLNVKENLGVKDEDIITSEVTYIASNYISLTDDKKQKVEELIEILEDNEDVQSVYHNMEE